MRLRIYKTYFHTQGSRRAPAWKNFEKIYTTKTNPKNHNATGDMPNRYQNIRLTQFKIILTYNNNLEKGLRNQKKLSA